MSNNKEETTPFTFDCWERFLQKASEAELILSNTEIAQVKQLAENNGPLARIQAALVDFAEEIKHNVFKCDVSTEAGRVQFAQLQSTYNGLLMQKELFEKILTITIVSEQTND